MTKAIRNKYTTGVLMEAIKQAGSQKAMGDCLNVSGDKVCKYVNEHRPWTVATIAKLAEHTKTDPLPMLLEMLLSSLDTGKAEQLAVKERLEGALTALLDKASSKGVPNGV